MTAEPRSTDKKSSQAAHLSVEEPMRWMGGYNEEALSTREESNYKGVRGSRVDGRVARSLLFSGRSLTSALRYPLTQ